MDSGRVYWPTLRRATRDAGDTFSPPRGGALMRFLACAALLLACSLPALADTYVYVSVAGEKKIAVYHLDTEQGTLAHRAVSGTFAGAEEEDPARLQPEV